MYHFKKILINCIIKQIFSFFLLIYLLNNSLRLKFEHTVLICNLSFRSKNKKKGEKKNYFYLN